MSHIVSIELQVKDLDALAKAAKSLGLEFVQDQYLYRHYGNNQSKCDHAIVDRNSRQTYEIGVSRHGDQSKGYVLNLDFWPSGGLTAKIGANGDKLKQAYAREVTVKHYQKQGYRVTQYAKADGSIVLKASR